MAGTQQNVAPMSKNSMERVDLDEPTSFLDHVFLGCTPNEDIDSQYIEMFESRISTTATEKFPGWETSRNSCRTFLSHHLNIIQIIRKTGSWVGATSILFQMQCSTKCALLRRSRAACISV